MARSYERKRLSKVFHDHVGINFDGFSMNVFIVSGDNDTFMAIMAFLNPAAKPRLPRPRIPHNSPRTWITQEPHIL
jgi:hypothetical protein